MNSTNAVPISIQAVSPVSGTNSTGGPFVSSRTRDGAWRSETIPEDFDRIGLVNHPLTRRKPSVHTTVGQATPGRPRAVLPLPSGDATTEEQVTTAGGPIAAAETVAPLARELAARGRGRPAVCPSAWSSPCATPGCAASSCRPVMAGPRSSRSWDCGRPRSWRRADGAAGWCMNIASTTATMSWYLEPAWAEQIYGDPTVITGGAFAPTGRGHAVRRRLRHRPGPLGLGQRHPALPVDQLRRAGRRRRLPPHVRAAVRGRLPRHVARGRPAGHRVARLRGAGRVGARRSGGPAGPFEDQGRHAAVPLPELRAPGRRPGRGLPRHRRPRPRRARRAARRGSPRSAPSRCPPRATCSSTWPAPPPRSAPPGPTSTTRSAGSGTWSCAGSRPTLLQRAEGRLAAHHAAAEAARAVDLAFTAAGGSAVYSDAPLQRCLRDVHVATQHAMVSPRLLETFAKVRLGIEADTALL